MCLHQDRGQRMRQMDSLMPTLNDLYKRGRMTWTEQGKGWIGRPEEVLGALATDGFYECHRERPASPRMTAEKTTMLISTSISEKPDRVSG